MTLKAESVMFFDFMFIALLAAFGSTQTGISFFGLQSIPQPPISPLPSVNCQSLCSPFSGLVQATAYIGWAIVNIPVLLGYLVVVVITFLNIILQITFSPRFNPPGVPAIGFFFLAIQFVVLMEIFRIFRGSSSGV